MSCLAKLNDAIIYLFEIFIKVPCIYAFGIIFGVIKSCTNDGLMIDHFRSMLVFNIIDIDIWIIDDDGLIRRIRLDLR